MEQTRIFKGDRRLIDNGAGYFKFVQAKAGHTIHLSKNKGRQILSAGEGEDKQSGCVLTKHFHKWNKVWFIAGIICIEDALRLAQAVEDERIG